MPPLDSATVDVDLAEITRFNEFIEYIQRTQFFSHWKKSQLLGEISRVTASIDEKSQSSATTVFFHTLKELNKELYVLTHCGDVPSLEDLVHALWSFQNPDSTLGLKSIMRSRIASVVEDSSVVSQGLISSTSIGNDVVYN
jgi:hypothetical protein